MIKKLKEFDKNYSNMFFYFSLLIIIIFLFYISTSNKSNSDVCTIPNDIVKNYLSYSYNVVYKENDKTIKLFIKRYESKYLMEKEENGVKSTYYYRYTDLMEKASNGKYIKFRGDEIIPGVNNKFLLIDYINDISLESSVSEKNGLTCYNNRSLELSMCINVDKSVELKKDNYTILYEVLELGSVSDFNIEISNEENINIPNNENIVDNVVN